MSAAGRLYLCRISDLKKMEQLGCSINLQVTRVKPIKGWSWVPHLAPSAGLFRQTRHWMANGMWPEKWTEYALRFKQEMKEARMAACLARIEQHLRSGQSVSLACFCSDEDHCHRSLLGKYFKNLGYEVISI